MAVLIRQNRLAHIEEKRARLELQVNLPAEQKATKIIQLLEELRLDLPNVRNVRNRVDPNAALSKLESRLESRQADDV
jgi:uncharacterized membrane protein